MKARWKWVVLAAIAAVAVAVGVGIAWVLWGPFSFESAAAEAQEEVALLNSRDPQQILAETTNRFYSGHNLPLALPLYRRAGKVEKSKILIALKSLKKTGSRYIFRYSEKVPTWQAPLNQ
jgi:hypothetical protein